MIHISNLKKGYKKGLINEYDAEVRLYRDYEINVGAPIYGYIYKDSRGRFDDGTQIHTSVVISYDPETRIAETRNTKYKILEWDNK